MKKKKKQTENGNLTPTLKDKAEGVLAQFPIVPGEMQEKAAEDLLYELQVHQVELEMQNEELHRVQLTLEESRQRFADLYDFAPVGYLTLTPQGLIKEVNFTGSALLGVARQKLIKTPFRKMVTANDQDLWVKHFMSVLEYEEKQTCDLMLKRQNGVIFYAGLESIRKEVSRGVFEIHTTVSDITERKRLEEALRKSEEKYRIAVIEEIEEGYYEVDLGGNFTFVNNSMTRLLQYSREELIGMNYRTYISPEEVDGVYKTYNRVFRTGEIIKEWQVTNFRKDGTPIFLENSISCRWDKEGRVIGFRGISRDITERKWAEAKLLESEEKYRSLSSTDDSMYLVDKECRFQFMNDSHLARLGASLDEVIGRPYGDFHSQEDSQQFAGIIKEVFETKKSFQIEYKSEREPNYFFRTFSPVRDQQGNVTVVTVVSKDITKLKWLEETLRSELNFAEGLINTAQAIILILDPEGRIVRLNPYMEKLSGYSLAEVLGKDWFSTFLPPQDQRRIKSLFFKAINDIQTQGNVNPILTKDGRERQIEWYDKTLKDAEGNSIGVLVVGHDITERKQAEEQLRTSREQMRSFAGRLQTVREEERTQIAREIHDELGGDLTALKIDFSLLTRSFGEIENETIRTSLLADIDSMTKFIDTTIQTVRRIAMELRPGLLDDLGLVAALEWQLKDFEKRTGIQCEFFSPVEPIALEADLSTTLFRIFQEALTNVARHSGATEVHVRLHADADSCFLEVEDNGKGIEKEEILNSKSLGLLGMRERAQMFGGRLHVTGTPGRGTSLMVEIPLVEKRKMDRKQRGDAQ